MSDSVVAPVAPAAAAATPAAGAAAEVPAIKPAEVEPSDEYEIDGKKVTLTRTQARTHIQKAGAVDKRFQETVEQKKKLDALIAEFEADPEAAIRKAGKDPDKILEGLLARKAKLALLTPEQRAADALREERDALKKKDEAREAEKKAADDKAADEVSEKALTAQLIEAANKYGLDATPEALEDLASVALDLMEYGQRPSTDQVAQEYLRREQEHLEERDRKLLPRLSGERLRNYLKANITRVLALPPAELLEVLGPEGVRAVQAATLVAKPSSTAAKKPDAPARVSPPRNGAGRFTNEADFDKTYRR